MVFDRSTFRKVNVFELSPRGLYILGLVTASGKIFWEEAFDPGAKVLLLRPWRSPSTPAAKPLASMLRGDFDGSGQVDETDVVFLFAWLAAQVEFPTTQMDAGDIDDNGKVDWMDLAYLGAYVYADPRPSANPHGIGEALSQPLTGRLEPDPATVDWSQQGVWHRFTVKLEGGRGNELVRIQVNVDDRQDRTLAISSFRRQSGAGCVTWFKANAFKRHDDTVYIARCGYGVSSISMSHWTDQASTDERGNAVWGWALLGFNEIEATAPPPPADHTFDIELVFVDEGIFDARERGWIEDAASFWEQVIVRGLPDFVPWVVEPYEIETFVGTVTSRGPIDDLRIFVGVFDAPDGRVLGRGGPIAVRSRSEQGGTWLPVTAFLGINVAKMDDIDRGNAWYALALHEIGHCLGFTASAFDWFELLRSPSAENSGADAHFIGSNAIAAFNRLGGANYRGAKVPLENRDGASNGHWRQSVFQNEIMDPNFGIGEYFSEITIGAMEDMGYEVDYAAADDYRLPRQASKPVAHLPQGWCEVLEPVGAIGPNGEMVEF